MSEEAAIDQLAEPEAAGVTLVDVNGIADAVDAAKRGRAGSR